MWLQPRSIQPTKGSGWACASIGMYVPPHTHTSRWRCDVDARPCMGRPWCRAAPRGHQSSSTIACVRACVCACVRARVACSRLLNTSHTSLEPDIVCLCAPPSGPCRLLSVCVVCFVTLSYTHKKCMLAATTPHWFPPSGLPDEDDQERAASCRGFALRLSRGGGEAVCLE